MKLSQFFSSPAALTVRGRPVRVRIIRREQSLTVADAEALLSFVSESDRAEAHRQADEAINARYKGRPVPDDARSDERCLHVLQLALRDVDPPHGLFADTPDQLRNALTLPAIQELWAEYQRYLAEEFPPYVDATEFGRLVEEAKKKPLPDLLDSFDCDFVRRSMPGLASLLLPYPTPK